MLSYTELARYFDKDRPLFAFECTQPQDGMRLEDLAAWYITVMRKHQPQGPYYIGGWSLGGVFALEIAHQLKDMGEEVAMLLMVDTLSVFKGFKEQYEPETRHALGYIYELSIRYQIPLHMTHEELAGLTPEEQFVEIMKKVETVMTMESEFERDMMKQIYWVTRFLLSAFDNYDLKPYPGTITLFRAMDDQLRDVEFYANGYGWRDHADGVDIIDIPGNHVTMLQKPHITELVKCLESCLAKIEDRETDLKEIPT